MFIGKLNMERKKNTFNIHELIDEKDVTPELFYTIVEISKGSKNKYELDKKTGLLRLDRILFTSTHYPANYGFIPRTYSSDDDPLDVLILTNEEIIPNALVQCRAIGVIKMIDNGQIDEKIIAVCINDPLYNSFYDISQLPNHIFEEIKHFFAVYKTLENKLTFVGNIEGNEKAKEIIAKSIKAYNRRLKEDDAEIESFS